MFRVTESTTNSRIRGSGPSAQRGNANAAFGWRCSRDRMALYGSVNNDGVPANSAIHQGKRDQ
jgi:hypothetical protein